MITEQSHVDRMNWHPMGTEEMGGTSGLRDWHLWGRGRSGHGAGGPYTKMVTLGLESPRLKSQGILLWECVQRKGDRIYIVLGITYPFYSFPQMFACLLSS